MKAISKFPRILLYPSAIDFRKGRKSLAIFVQSVLEENPFDGTLFVFINRRKDCLKKLYWDKTGFALWEKELEEQKFAWPKNDSAACINISAEQMEWLLEGIDISKMKPHRELQYSLVI